VTVPHKEKIIPFLDKIDPATQLIGAVNTVVNTDGVLTGYNTDASGFMRSLKGSMEFEPLGKNIVILGAGGACRAVSVALAFAGVNSVMVANRHPERAENLISALKPHFHDVCLASCGYTDDTYLAALAAADLVVNATSVGLHGESLAFLPLECIKGSALIFDMIYSLSKTTLIKNAHELNLRSDDGLSMLAAQGEDAFALWTGFQPAQGFMRDFLVRRRTE
jgi:shikimate dehydrogenase